MRSAIFCTIFCGRPSIGEMPLAREYRLKLEALVEGVPAEVFTATRAARDEAGGKI